MGMKARPSTASTKAASANQKTVDAYIGGLSDWRGEVVAAVRALIREAAPDATEAIKWAQPVYELNGPFAYVRAFTSHVNFGFWRGADLADKHKLLVGTGTTMRHVTLSSAADLRDDAFKELVRNAVRLNRTLGDPTRQ